MIAGNIAKRWKELSGYNKWENLLNPLDNDLRQYIIHYGNTAQATYDTFNAEKASKYAGSSRYARKNLFTRVGLGVTNPFMKYDVVKYFYATSRISMPDAFLLKSSSTNNARSSMVSNWMGYIAVATDEGKKILGRRDILIAWRGTIQESEWVKDFDFPLVSASKLFGETGNPQVHQGWLSIYTSDDPKSPYVKTSARKQVLSEVKRLMSSYEDEDISITVTGHSLGASLGTLNASDIVANKINKPKTNKSCPVTAFLFSSPRVGDSHFRDVVQSMENLHILRIRNIRDIIASLPPGNYQDVGEELLIDSGKSPHLKKPGDVFSWHNMEVYQHTLAGTKGIKQGFHMQVHRDISLVNKWSGALKEGCFVPTNWWCEKNKGMVEQPNGTWKLNDHERDDNDVDEI